MPADLQKIPLTATAPVVEAARRLVRIKEALDDLCASQNTTWAVNQLCPGLFNAAMSATDGNSFVSAIVPFVGAAGPETPGLLDLGILIGESWRWKECFTSSPTAGELETYLTETERACRGNQDASLTTLIEPLGLAVAHEGKNRVRFLRDRGVEYIPSAVAYADYPAPERLRIFHLRQQAEDAVWCVLDRRWLRPLALPQLTHLILDPYGVSTSRTWPADLPSLDLVRDAVARSGRGPGRSCEPIDLNAIADRQRLDLEREEWIPTSLLSLEVYRPRWQLVTAACAAMSGGFIGVRYLPDPISGPATWATAGMVLGAVLACCSPWVRARRKHLL